MPNRRVKPPTETTQANSMTFWEFSFCYIFKGYINSGEKRSAHIYSLCILSLLLALNSLSFAFILFSDNFLHSAKFKSLILITFFVILSINSLYFLRNGKYWNLFIKYSTLHKAQSNRKKFFFWTYFSVSILFLVYSI
jgi:hypothetical protein